MKTRKITNSKKLRAEAYKVLLGGGSFLSKKPERFLREGWPAYFTKAKGIEIIDVDGNRWLDFSYMGVGANLLGYNDADVNKAAKKAIDNGTQSTLSSPEEIELAKELLKLNPWADLVRYARTGGEIASIAVRIARAHTGREKVAFCGYHGYHDWYLAANLSDDQNLVGHLLPGLAPLGVPQALLGTVLPFRYNHFEELEAIFKKHKDVGVIMMEPMRNQEPKDGFLQKVRKLADAHGAVLIFDEISAGFRLGFPGVHTKFKVIPDIATYSKAMSNGIPMAALVGKKKVMQSAEFSFISSLYHSERVGPAAAIATLKKLKKLKVDVYVNKLGWRIGSVWERAAKKAGLPIVISGPGALVNFTFDRDDAAALKALFTQEMLKYGYLATASLYVSYAHKPSHLADYEKAVEQAFVVLADAIKKDDALKRLKGGLPETGFKRLT